LWAQLFGELPLNFTKPVIPKPYTGPDFYNTDQQGGYGYPSSGMYSLSTKGYATFGALGQGPSKDMNVEDNTSNRLRTMIVTVLPGSGFSQGGKTIAFEATAGDFNEEYDFSTPQLPFVYGYTNPNDDKMTIGASCVKIAAISALSIMSFTLF